MKGFIEVTENGGTDCKTLIAISTIKEIIEPSDSSYRHTYVEIITNSKSFFINESYNKIKELIKQSM